MSVWGLPPGTPFFPHPDLATEDGLLAYGFELYPELILAAYHFGIFPWCNEGDPILWWHTSPRCVLFPAEFKTSKSMRSFLRKTSLKVSVNQNFRGVIQACAEIYREGQSGETWIREDIADTYTELHHSGHAHSIEVWDGEELVGGLYGLFLGKIFFGESMFSKKSNASKLALHHLCEMGIAHHFTLIDCQQTTPHLQSLGAQEISGKIFQQHLRENRRITLMSKELNPFM